MEVILLDNLDKVGKLGDIVNVKDGYARNYLIPKKLCLRASKASKLLFEQQKEELLAASNKKAELAGQKAAKVEGKKIVIIKNAGENGNLYGSVSPIDIINILNDQFSISGINKVDVIFSDTIKTLGIYNIQVKFHADLFANLSLNVARTQADAQTQWEKHTQAQKAAKEKAAVDNIGSSEKETSKEEKAASETVAS